MSTPFAAYCRTSLEDGLQDAVASRGWQLNRAEQLIGPHDGEIVAVYHDIGQSRSLPWRRRPEATKLLAAVRDPARGFRDLVVAEPQRAFAGSEFSIVFPVLNHFGVRLWIPEIGGPVDPDSESHDLMLAMYGTISKSERRRIQVRVRAGMRNYAQNEGHRHLGGRPPYGYRLADAGPHPHPKKAADGKRLHCLEVDPLAAPIVEEIFTMYVGGDGLYAIAEALTRRDIPSPSAHDAARNGHRQKSKGAWSKGAVRAILTNPRYTGHQVWGRKRRVEVLRDPDDVTLGHDSKFKANDPTEWTLSSEVVHPPLVSPELFEAAQEVRRARPPQSVPGRTTRRNHTYALRGLCTCSLCDRKMQGVQISSQPYLRCGWPAEYAAKTDAHPKRVYLREAAVTSELDRWLAQVFSPRNIEGTIEALAHAASEEPAVVDMRVAAAKQALADSERKLAEYKAQIDRGGALPEIFGPWLNEAHAERLSAQRELAKYEPRDPLSADEIRELVRAVRDPVRLLRKANADRKNELYRALGIGLRYKPEERKVLVECAPTLDVHTGRVGGGI